MFGHSVLISQSFGDFTSLFPLYLMVCLRRYFYHSRISISSGDRKSRISCKNLHPVSFFQLFSRWWKCWKKKKTLAVICRVWHMTAGLYVSAIHPPTQWRAWVKYKSRLPVTDNITTWSRMTWESTSFSALKLEIISIFVSELLLFVTIKWESVNWKRTRFSSQGEVHVFITNFDQG